MVQMVLAEVVLALHPVEAGSTSHECCEKTVSAFIRHAVMSLTEVPW